VPAHQRDLIAGSLHARQRLFAHRGLPLDALEFYGAASMSFNGRLTPAIQDHQIASWLIGHQWFSRETLPHSVSRILLTKEPASIF
jgi:hypothetical protein